MLKDQTQRDLATTKFDGNILISAGAGCGKTHVLTERILNIVLKEIDDNHEIVKQLLVLTFTKKAAAEMKSRIREALLKDPKGRYVASDVESADITTIDAFALSIVKRFKHKLGLKSSIEIGDDVIFETKLREIIGNKLEQYYEKALDNEDDLFTNLIKHYCLKDDEIIIRFIMMIIKLASENPDGFNFVRSLNTVDFYNQLIPLLEKEILSDVNYRIERIKKLTDSLSEDSIKVVDYIYLRCTDYSSVKSYDDLISIIDVNSSKRFPSCKNENDKETLGIIKKEFKKIKEYRCTNGIEDFKKDISESAHYISLLINIAQDCNVELNIFKLKHSMYSFSDIFKYAFKLVKWNDDVRCYYVNKYKYVCLDEYQDTNDNQEELIRLVSSNNVFQVGDIKQSIYGFRSANCDLFNDKYKKYSQGDGGQLLRLTENFRTRKTVLDSINEIFEKLMINGVGGCNYEDGHSLGHGQIKYDTTETQENYKTETLVYDESVYTGDRAELEATLIANDIIEKVNNGFKVHDRDTFAYRNCGYGDFAILTKSTTEYQIFEKVFNWAGVPLEVPDKSDFAEKDCLVVLLSFLKLINEIKKDNDPQKLKLYYLSIKRSFVFMDDDKDLYNEIISKSYLNSDLMHTLNDNIYKLSHLNNEDLLQWIINTFHLYDSLIKLGDIKINYSRIQEMLDKAKNCDLLNWDLEEFINLFEQMEMHDIKEISKAAPSSNNSVKLMTMHSSKGLEFQIVYLPRLESKFQYDSTSFIANRKFGLSLPSYKNKSPNLTSIVFKVVNEFETLSEAMRLFYVACTRAREKLIFVSTTGKDKMPTDILSCKSMKDLLVFSGYFEDSKIVKDIDVFHANNQETKKNKKIVFKKLPKLPESIKVEKERASKSINSAVDPDTLLYGTKLHRILELIDLKTKDLSWLNEEERKLFEPIMELPLFSSTKSAQIFHEYAFQDIQNNTEGIIDLLLVYDDHIDIVDYKTSIIDDVAYAKQLSVYCDYLRSVFPEIPINKYLLSIKQCRVLKIE